MQPEMLLCAAVVQNEGQHSAAAEETDPGASGKGRAHAPPVQGDQARQSRDPTQALCLLKMGVSLAVCSCDAGVPPLVLCDTVGGFASWRFLLKMPHVPTAAVFTGPDLHF